MYKVQKEGSRGALRTLHRNMLLPLVLPRPIVVSESKSSLEVESQHASELEGTSSDDRSVRVSFPQGNVVDTSNSGSSSASASHSSESDVESSSSDVSPDDRPPPVRRSARTRRPPAWLRSGEYQTQLHQLQQFEPKDRFHVLVHVYQSFLDHHAKMFQAMLSVFRT